MEDRITLPEVVCALSLATDLAMGEPLESGLAITLRAVALAEECGVADAERDRVYWVALLRHVGCTAENSAFAEIVGDELEFRHSAGPVDPTSPRGLMPHLLRHVVRAHGLFGAAAVLGRLVRERDRFNEAVLAVCEVAELIASRLGLSESVQNDLLLGNERWDGKSFLRRTQEEAVPMPVRIVQVAECASVYDVLGGTDAATSIVRERRGHAFDPRIAAAFAAKADALLSVGRTDSLWERAMTVAPEAPGLHAERLDAALGAMAEFVDLKSPFTVGHSNGVAELAARAAGGEADLLRRAGLVHDVGRVGVSGSVWDKTDPLTVDDWERVRLHPYLTERVLARAPGLAALADVASLHHERCDGSGYHRGVGARSLSYPARVLAAGRRLPRDDRAAAASPGARSGSRSRRAPRREPRRPARRRRGRGRDLGRGRTSAPPAGSGGRANRPGARRSSAGRARTVDEADRRRAGHLAEDGGQPHPTHLREDRRLHARRCDRVRDAARPCRKIR